MAGIKITELPPSGTLEITDLTYAVKTSTDTSVQTTFADILNLVQRVQSGDVFGGTMVRLSAEFGSELLLVTGQSGSFTGIQYEQDYSANYVDNSLIARKDAPLIIRSNGTPCLNNVIPLRVGDLYFDHGGNDLYYAYDVADCLNWIKIQKSIGEAYNPTQISFPIVNQSISFTQGTYNYVGSVVSCKVKVQLLMGGLAFHSYTFKINLPIVPSGSFANTYDIQGSVIPSGNVTLWHKVNHTSIIASDQIGIPCAEIFVETDNSMNGVCEFVIDFSYIMF